jgi:hypothetical protein
MAGIRNVYNILIGNLKGLDFFGVLSDSNH